MQNVEGVAAICAANSGVGGDFPHPLKKIPQKKKTNFEVKTFVFLPCSMLLWIGFRHRRRKDNREQYREQRLVLHR